MPCTHKPLGKLPGFPRRSLVVLALLALGSSPYSPVIDGVTAATAIKVVAPTLALVANNANLGDNVTLTVAEGQRVSIEAHGGDIYNYPVEVMMLSNLPTGAQFTGNLSGVNPVGVFTWTPPVGTAAASPMNLFTFASYNDFNGKRTLKSVTVKVSASATARADCLFNWAEKNYPSLFAPTGYQTTVWTIYTYRWYSANNAYLGISSQDDHVYYMGADGNLVDEGPASYWLPLAGCQ